MVLVESILDRYRRHDPRALARVLTWIARGEHLSAIARAVPRDQAPSRVVAVTGSGGVGKSTLIARLIERARQSGTTVAVLACDPESPLTGGAVLGDRVRMSSPAEDRGVFIRSLAAPSGLQGIPENLGLMVAALQGFGFDLVLVETVGVGQGDTAVRNLADVVVLLIQPESGDEYQWQKAGVLEITDLVVVNKADLPGAERTEAQVRELLQLPGFRKVPVIRLSARCGEGIEPLWRLIESADRRGPTAVPDGPSLLRLLQDRLSQLFQSRIEEFEPILERWRRGELDDTRACRELLEALAAEHRKMGGPPSCQGPC